MDYKILREEIEQLFRQKGIDETSDIDWIFVEVTGTQRSMLRFSSEISDSEAEKIRSIARKRAEHIPLDYVLGKTNFYGRDFLVDERVLIPRADTEVLIEQVIKSLSHCVKTPSVLDIGTGSGAIALTISLETDAEVMAVDISDGAIELATQNAERLGAKVEILKSDLFSAVGGRKFDYIVSNPPYIESEVINSLSQEVRREPMLALDGGQDGLEFYRKIISQASQHLNSGGKVYFEIGFNQAEPVAELLKQDFCKIHVVKDYGGNDRVVYAELRSKYDRKIKDY